MAINLSLSKMPWYGQVVAFVALGLAAVGAFWNFYALGAQEGIDTQRRELSALRAEIDRGKAAERRLPEFRRELASLEGQMARLRAVLPDERDVADLLRRVQGMATQSRLTILGFTPKAVTKKPMYVEWPIGLKLEGTYHDLGLFLERVSKFPRIINVSNLKLKTADKSAGAASITVEATATTFVLIEGEPAEATTKTKKKGKGKVAAKAAPAPERTE